MNWVGNSTSPPSSRRASTTPSPPRARRSTSPMPAITRWIRCASKKPIVIGATTSPTRTLRWKRGLGFAVKFDKAGGFIGREALLKGKAAGRPAKRLLQFRLLDPRPLLYHNEPIWARSRPGRLRHVRRLRPHPRRRHRPRLRRYGQGAEPGRGRLQHRSGGGTDTGRGFINPDVRPSKPAHPPADGGSICIRHRSGRDGKFTLSGFVPDHRSRSELVAAVRSDGWQAEILGTANPIKTPTGSSNTQKCLFAGYLVLDAVIGNTDRHHENWGLLLRRTETGWKGQVAPSFDHASSLGEGTPGLGPRSNSPAASSEPLFGATVAVESTGRKATRAV